MLATLGWKTLTRSYFEENVLPADPYWNWAQSAMPLAFVMALYRASFFYGICRWVTWLLWAHVLNAYQFDITWGGPTWVPGLSASGMRAGGLPLVAACSCGGSCCGGF